MKLICIGAMLLITFPLFSQEEAVRKKHFNVENNIAIGGYDPVTYFTSNKAIPGKKALLFNYAGITYYFSSMASRDLFKSNPSKYEPQFGGWCAYAMGDTGEKVEVDPQTFKIVNGRLYLFYNKYFNNTLKSWNKDEPNLKSKAEKNWVALYR